LEGDNMEPMIIFAGALIGGLVGTFTFQVWYVKWCEKKSIGALENAEKINAMHIEALRMAEDAIALYFWECRVCKSNISLIEGEPVETCPICRSPREPGPLTAKFVYPNTKPKE
jgi:uncharacterized CHY-type Zn-finger protein